MTSFDPSTVPEGPDYNSPDPNGPQLTPVQWGIIWAILYVMPDAMNAPIRQAIEDYFAASGVDTGAMRLMAGLAQQQAERTGGE